MLIPNGNFGSSVTKYLDEISESQAEHGISLLARWIFRTGLPFSMVSANSFHQFVKFLRPAFVKFLPSPKTLSTVLLHKEYDRIKQLTIGKISDQKWFSIVSDSWTGINRTKLANIMIVTPLEKPFFLKSIDLSGESITGEYIYNMIKDVAHELGMNKWLSFISDSARNMQAAWKMIKRDFPDVFAHGCAPHSLNNFLKDLIKKVEAISKLKEDALKVIRFVMNHDVVLSKFRAITGKANSILKFPCDTRFATYYDMFKCLLEQKLVLIEMLDAYNDLFVQRKVEGLQMARSIVENTSFWGRLKFTSNELMKPVSFIIIFQGLRYVLLTVLQLNIMLKVYSNLLGCRSNNNVRVKRRSCWAGIFSVSDLKEAL